MNATLDQSKSNRLWQTASGLAIFTIIYNMLEGMVSLYFGAEENALTLAGFGVDSFIEVVSGVGIVAMVARLRHQESSERDRFERTTLRLTGACFYGLTACLLIGAVASVWQHQHPTTTVAGLGIALVSIAIMRLLALWKIRVGQQLQSAPIMADAHCTMVCLYMSVVLLVTSLLYEIFKSPLLDAAGMIGLSWFAFKEGKESFDKAKGVASCCNNCQS